MMDEFKISRIQYPTVTITKRMAQGKWIIGIRGVTSGFVVHTESDNSTIEFQFDAERFDPIIKLS